MKILLRALMLASLLLVGIRVEPGEISEREAFDRKMYSVIPLHNFGTNPQQFASLDDGKKQSLLACRDVLLSLFRALDTNGDISKFLTPELSKKYRTGADFVDPETSLEEVGILDWDFVSRETEIQLRFVAIVYSEGNWIFSKNTAILKKSGSGWRISKLNLNEKQDE